MARIRTIKPEFPQSESMGRVSRDARLLFVQLWTIADDAGRARAASRMLASLLFPYDDDAPTLIDGWLDELEREGCITRYQVDGSTYLQIAKWLSHQKIDKPSASKFPSIDEGSRILANARESSPLDQGPRTKEEDQGDTSPDGDVGKTAGAVVADCPQQQIIDLYHRLLPMGRQVRDWTPARASALRARWRDKPARQKLEWWERFFAYCAESDFLTGKVNSPGRRPFELSLDWLVKAENMAKVIEGAYENERQAA
jgi:hypothetical protein